MSATAIRGVVAVVFARDGPRASKGIKRARIPRARAGVRSGARQRAKSAGDTVARHYVRVRRGVHVSRLSPRISALASTARRWCSRRASRSRRGDARRASSARGSLLVVLRHACGSPLVGAASLGSPPLAPLASNPLDLRLRADAVRLAGANGAPTTARADDEGARSPRSRRRQRGARHGVDPRRGGPARRPPTRSGPAPRTRAPRRVTSPGRRRRHECRRRQAESRPTGSAGGSDRAKRLRKNGGFNRDLPHISRAQPLCPVCCPLATGDSHLSHLHDGRTRRHGGPRCHAPRSRRRREEKGGGDSDDEDPDVRPRELARLCVMPHPETTRRFRFSHRTPLVASRSLEAGHPRGAVVARVEADLPSRPTRRFKRLRDARLRGSDRPPSHARSSPRAWTRRTSWPRSASSAATPAWSARSRASSTASPASPAASSRSSTTR